MKHYQALMELPGIAAHEKRIQTYMKEFILKYPSYELKKDNLGGLFAYKRSKNDDAPTVVIAAHMDEVGLMVKHITQNGGIKVLPIGGLAPEVFISQLLYIYTADGQKIPGVIGSVPPHLKVENKLDFNHLVLDIGVNSKEEALKLGVQIGDMVLFETSFTYTANGKRFLAKAIDNRFGCGLVLDAIKQFKDATFDFHLAIGATVQEEVGLRGAETATNMLKPDLFIALDASPLNDLHDQDSLAVLGGGFLLRVYDPRNIMLPPFRAYFEHLAKTKGIKYQPYISLGGTDAAKAHTMYEGIISTTIGLPARYIHSTVAMADLDDINAARDMLYALIQDLNSQKIKTLKELM